MTSWGWARYCSKQIHVKDCNKCIKICASSWSLSKVTKRVLPNKFNKQVNSTCFKTIYSKKWLDDDDKHDNDYSNYNAFTNSINIIIWLYLLHAVHPDVLYDSQGIRIIQSNTSFLLLKYTYIQGHVFQLRGAIIRPLP